MDRALRASFRQPFPQQVAAFRARLGNLVPTSRWDDLERNAHDRAFMVAGAAKADLLADLGAAVDKAISQGTGIEAFRKDFDALVERHGWHGWTGEETAAGRAWRTRVIYSTNMRVSMAAGRHAQLKDGNFPFWVYRHSGAEHPRLQHLAWDGLVLPPDHPFWAKHYPPNGWGCGCYVRGTRSRRRASKVGGDPDKVLEDGWDQPDPRTGAPKGIGKGWDYAPGSTVNQTIQALIAKPVHWPYELGKAYMGSLPQAVVNDFTRGFRKQPSLADETRRMVQRVLRQESQDAETIAKTTGQRYLTWGRLSSQHVDEFARSGLAVDGYDFTLDVQSILHIHRRHMQTLAGVSSRERLVTAADIARVPSLLDGEISFGQAGELRTAGSGALQTAITVRVDGEVWTIVLERRKRRRMMTLATLFINRIG